LAYIHYDQISFHHVRRNTNTSKTYN
jgi:hypothetical protein